MTYGLSNGHVIDDVKWPRKVKLVTPIRLQRNSSKMAGFTYSILKDHQYEMTWAIKWSRDRWRHVKLKGAVTQYGRLS